MRISSGIARGIFLKSPKGDATRPATDAARLAIFSSISDLVEGARVLDLFAGTGSYGLEAASRGATSVDFVEKDKRALMCLKENIESVKKATNGFESKVYSCDVFSLKKESFSKEFDLIFADPPYPLLLKNPDEIFEKIASLCSENTLAMLEAPADFEPPTSSKFELVKRLGKKSKGKPSQLILKLKSEDSKDEI